jgi:hypothetical protein
MGGGGAAHDQCQCTRRGREGGAGPAHPAGGRFLIRPAVRFGGSTQAARGRTGVSPPPPPSLAVVGTWVDRPLGGVAGGEACGSRGWAAVGLYGGTRGVKCQNLPLCGQLGAARSRQDESKEVGGVGSKRTSSVLGGKWGVGGMSFFVVRWIGLFFGCWVRWPIMRVRLAGPAAIPF